MNPLRIVILSLAAVTTFAAEEKDPVRPIDRPYTREQQRFLMLDVNGDRRLSWEEFHVDGASRLEFTELDRDGDGFLSMSEFTSRPIPQDK